MLKAEKNQIENRVPDKDLLGAILLWSEDSLLLRSDDKLLWLLLLNSRLLLAHHKLLLGPDDHLVKGIVILKISILDHLSSLPVVLCWFLQA